MSSQRPFFLSTFFAAFRQTPASLSSAGSSAQPPNKHSTQASASVPQTSAATPRSTSSTAAAAAASQATSPPSRAGGVLSQLPLHSPRHHHHHHHHHHSSGIPIPQPQGHRDNNHGRRRGSDSSSEGFREALGAEKLYIGGRTAAGEERFFKLGVVRRIKSGDRLSLDRLSL